MHELFKSIISKNEAIDGNEGNVNSEWNSKPSSIQIKKLFKKKETYKPGSFHYMDAEIIYTDSTALFYFHFSTSFISYGKLKNHFNSKKLNLHRTSLY